MHWRLRSMRAHVNCAWCMMTDRCDIRLPVPAGLMQPVARRLRNRIVHVISPEADFGVDYDQPLGDPGLFGPQSATWKMHADFPGMMAGGLCALMLQTLHPRALAGVWDHSSFREDALERLRRTTLFVGATSYAPRADAERLIEHVDRVHDRIHGATADGQVYSAHDPDLLTWVHCTQVYGFLNGYLVYRRPDVPGHEQDRYLDEYRRVAEMLGARNVPASRAQLQDYFESVQDELRFDARARATLAVLDEIPLPVAAASVPRRVFIGAGAALLPSWGRQLLERGRRQRVLDTAGSAALYRAGPVIRNAMSRGVAWRSTQRMGVSMDCLTFD